MGQERGLIVDHKRLHIELRVGDSISIDAGRVTLFLEEKSGRRARLRFDAETDVSIEPVRARVDNELQLAVKAPV